MEGGTEIRVKSRCVAGAEVKRNTGAQMQNKFQTWFINHLFLMNIYFI